GFRGGKSHCLIAPVGSAAPALLQDRGTAATLASAAWGRAVYVWTCRKAVATLSGNRLKLSTHAVRLERSEIFSRACAHRQPLRGGAPPQGGSHHRASARGF